MGIGTNFAVPGEATTQVLTAVLLQLHIKKEAMTMEEVNENIDYVFENIDRASRGMPGFDLVITPEIVLHGVSENSVKLGLTRDSPEVKRLQDKCRQLKIWGVFGAMMNMEDGSFCGNCAITINSDGEIVNIYQKTNPWIPYEMDTPGDEIQVFDGPKGSRMATIVCSDGDYQDTWREAGAKGANVIVRISDYMNPGQTAWDITNRAGAYFNRAYVLAVNTAGFDSEFCLFGKSMVVNPDGLVITQAPEGINYMLKADIYPGLCDYYKKNSYGGDMIWGGKHRGASCPDCAAEGGKDRSMYTY
jgi:predicted amidohydrolase